VAGEEEAAEAKVVVAEAEDVLVARGLLGPLGRWNSPKGLMHWWELCEYMPHTVQVRSGQHFCVWFVDRHA
jgi:hypothetical protein